jgi:uncharacterized membrane protein YoaK (UPF0700 family)
MPPAFRNALLLVLAGTAGYVDALCYLALKVFPANMTGNTVLFSIAVVQRDTPAIFNSGLTLAGFVAGSAAGAWIVDADERAAVWPRRVSGALALEGLILIAFAFAWWWAADRAFGNPLVRLALLATAAMAMGMQSAAARRLDVSGISTIVVTSMLTSLTARLVAAVRRGSAPISEPGHGLGLLAVWAIYAGGAGIAAASPRERLAALVFPAALIAAVVVASIIAPRRELRTRGSRRAT